MDKIKEKLMKFILEKTRENTSVEKPYFILKWSGFFELCRAYDQDLLEIIDKMADKGLIRKALIPTKKKDKNGKPIKLLAIALPENLISKKAKSLIEEFENFE
jgi:hypothetical protein